MPRLDLAEIQANARWAREWATSDPEPPHGPLGFVPLSVREHFDRNLPDLVAAVERFMAHSVTLNTVSWKIAQALGAVPEDVDQIQGDPVEQVDRLIAEIERLRAEVGNA